MHVRSTVWLSTIILLTSLMGGCTNSDDSGCVTDRECKADRICNTSGRCMSPGGGSGDRDADPSDASDAPEQPDAGPAADADSGSDANVGDAAYDGDDAADAPISDADVDADDVSQPDVGDCPRAVARARVQGEATWQSPSLTTDPLQTIELDGSQSTGDVERYEWTVLSRPQGSTQRLTPDSSSQTPRFFLDMAGVYKFALTVYDSDGVAGCGDSAHITITATPASDVVVELVWDTPADPDQTDNFGSDVDLHYLHETGRWNEAPWDVFWRNPDADWGVADDATDDPSLDIDDTDGAGPELISHDGLEQVKYSVGVYYYSDSTLGASYATVRIYVQGQLEHEIENKYLSATGSFWDVADIEDQGATITSRDRMYQGFP